MPASMMSAETGFKLNVIGSSIAMVATGPTPGSTPISVPSSTPMSAYSRLSGLTATPKPRMRLWKRSMRASAERECGRAHRERQRQALHEDQVREEDQDEEEDENLLPLELVAAVGADEDQGRGRAHQAEGDRKSTRLNSSHVAFYRM